MALIYTNKHIEQQVVNALRQLGHDVLTSLEAENANRAIADKDVLAFAVSQNRILITHNRLHFVRLHNHRARRTPELLFVVSISTTGAKRSEFTTRSSRALPMSLCG